jgi:hypothetical protein
MPISAFSGTGRSQFAPDGEQILVLGVDAPDTYGIFVFPLEHAEHIGGWSAEL